MWVFARTSTNFAHVVSFHYSSHRIRGLARSENAGHLTSENKAFKTQHSITVAREEREHDLISSPVSTLSARSAEHYDCNNVIKVQVRRIHWEIRLKDDK